MLSDTGRRDNAPYKATEYVQPNRLSASSAAQGASFGLGQHLGTERALVSAMRTDERMEHGKDELEKICAAEQAKLGRSIRARRAGQRCKMVAGGWAPAAGAAHHRYVVVSIPWPKGSRNERRSLSRRALPKQG